MFEIVIITVFSCTVLIGSNGYDSDTVTFLRIKGNPTLCSNRLGSGTPFETLQALKRPATLHARGMRQERSVRDPLFFRLTVSSGLGGSPSRLVEGGGREQSAAHLILSVPSSDTGYDMIQAACAYDMSGVRIACSISLPDRSMNRVSPQPLLGSEKLRAEAKLLNATKNEVLCCGLHQLRACPGPRRSMGCFLFVWGAELVVLRHSFYDVNHCDIV